MFNLKKTKTIEVYAEHIDIESIKPSPAVKSIPDWFKGIEAVRNNDLTIKRCIPVLDAFTTGYLFKTSVDYYYDKEYERFVDNGVSKAITMHPQVQIEGMEIDDSLSPKPYKWINNFYMKTPKGYSTIFTHPLNRTDLPFYSLTGVVDTDSHPLVVQFPFLIKKDFNGMIPAGTPIIQAIPFKRDDWQMIFPEQESGYSYKDMWKWFDPPMAAYKRNHWFRKNYK